MRPLAIVLLIPLMMPAGVFAQSRDKNKASGGAAMAVYQTPYYVMHTDIDRDDAREAALRMTRMAEAYYERTRSFSGSISRKFPFFLYRNANDYYRAGGLSGSAGCFMPSEGKLMAIAGEHPTDSTWHTVQHEGFHQFEAAVIRGQIPVWINEGLAEYFGEARFTGDNFIVGLIPPGRLAAVKKQIEKKDFKSIREMMTFSLKDWNQEMSGVNYDQAWSMVHFLVHGDNGAYQSAFSKFILSLGRGMQWERAWQASFGSTQGFEEKWEKYWQALPKDPTADLRTQATVSTLTSYLARAYVQKLSFADFGEFLAAAKDGKLKCSEEDWLPPSLLAGTIRHGREKGNWSLATPPNKPPQIVFVTSEQVRLVGLFTLNGMRVANVWVEVDDLANTIAEARKLIGEGKKDSAKKLLAKGLMDHPASPAADDARKAIAETK